MGLDIAGIVVSVSCVCCKCCWICSAGDKTSLSTEPTLLGNTGGEEVGILCATDCGVVL